MPRTWDESDVRIRPNKKGTRPRTKDRPAHKDAEVGRIITVDRGRYTAVLDEGNPSERSVTAVRARELRRSPVVVGDRVSLVGDTSGKPGTLARLVRIEARTSLLRRSADDTDPVERVVVANADQLVIVVASENPEPRTGFIDRSLAAAFDAGLTPLLCITKTDLKHPAWLLDYYRDVELTILLSKAQESRTPGKEDSVGLDPSLVDQLSKHFDGAVSVLLGHSGVGKSTLVNALTGAERATGHVNAVTGRGRHTSSSALALQPREGRAGTWIIDTPGIRSFGLAHISPDTLVASFTDLAPGSADCPKGCTHSATAENCGITAYVAAGRAGAAGPERLNSLRKLLRVDEETGDTEKELGVVDS